MRLMLFAALLPLSGCWFVYLPGSAVSAVSDSFTGAEGLHCVPDSTKVGDRVRLPAEGRIGTVKSLSGTSSRCQNPAMPIRALLELDPQEPGKSNVKEYERK